MYMKSILVIYEVLKVALDVQSFLPNNTTSKKGNVIVSN